MISRRDMAIGGCSLATLAHSGSVLAEGRPFGYPRSYDGLISSARKEGLLTIYTATDQREIEDILLAFRNRYPGIKIDYQRLRAATLYERFVGEVAAGRPTADLLFSSAMDTQIKLVNDGYAQAYASPEKPNLQPWAVWKDQAYGLTAEPIVFAYNRRLIPEADVPRSHDDLVRLLRRSGQSLRGKIVTYDPDISATGFLLFTQDLQISHDTWGLVKALGRTMPRFSDSSDDMLGEVISGRSALAYNMVSSYALERQGDNPVLGVVFPSDYTLVMSRIGFIAKEAAHPAAAKLFLDFLLSKAGQVSLARRHMASVRVDVPHPGFNVDPMTLRAIHVGPALLANLDQIRRRRVLQQWRAAVAEA